MRTAYPNELFHNGEAYDISEDELYHYGIKGQKWGVRRFQNPDGSLTSAGRKRYGVGEEKHGDLITWAAYKTLRLLTHVAITSAKRASAKKLIKKCDEERAAAPVEQKTGLKRQLYTKTTEEDAKRVNPEYNIDTDGAAHVNCVNCTMALELRRRGYEVQAKLKEQGRDGYKEGEEYFGAKTKKLLSEPKYTQDDNDEWIRFYRKYEPLARMGKNKEMANITISTIKKEPLGSRGQLCVSWDRYNGHSVGWEITNTGEFRIVDGQDGTVYNEKQARKFLMRACEGSYQRLDNCNFDAKKIKEAVR